MRRLCGTSGRRAGCKAAAALNRPGAEPPDGTRGFSRRSPPPPPGEAPLDRLVAVLIHPPLVRLNGSLRPIRLARW